MDRELEFLPGRDRSDTSVAFSPDGRFIVSGAADGLVRVWDSETKAEIAQFRSQEDQVNSVAFSPDGNRIACGGFGAVWVCDAKNGTVLHRLPGREKWLNAAFSPNGRRGITWAGDNQVQIWEAKSGDKLLCLTGPESRVHCVAYSFDSYRIVSGTDNGTIRVWNAETGEEMTCLSGDEGGANSVAFSPDGRRIVSGGWGNTVRIWDWDVETGVQPSQLVGNWTYVKSVAFLPDGRCIVWGSPKYGGDRVWDAETGVELSGLLEVQTNLVRSIAFSPDGRHIAYGTDDGDWRQLDFPSDDN